MRESARESERERAREREQERERTKERARARTCARAQRASERGSLGVAPGHLRRLTVAGVMRGVVGGGGLRFDTWPTTSFHFSSIAAASSAERTVKAYIYMYICIYVYM